jgi:hypothetical protein
MDPRSLFASAARSVAQTHAAAGAFSSTSASASPSTPSLPPDHPPLPPPHVRLAQVHAKLAGAVQRSAPSAVRALLLALDQDGSLPDRSGLLHLAADRGNVAVLALLLDAGLCPSGDAVDEAAFRRWCARERAAQGPGATSPPEQPAPAPLVRVDPRPAVSPLHVAVAAGNPHALELLCARAHTRRGDAARAGVSAPSPSFSPPRRSRFDDDDLVSSSSSSQPGPLGPDGSLDVDAPTHGFQDTPLHTACLLGQLSAVRVLVSRGADLEARGFGGQTPVFAAALCGHVAVLDLLLRAGADIAHPQRNSGGYGVEACEDPAEAAVALAGQVRTRLHALETRNDYINAPVGVTAACKRLATSASARQGIVLCLRILLAAGCPARLRLWHTSFYGAFSPLRAAVAYGDAAALRALLALGRARADPDELELVAAGDGDGVAGGGKDGGASGLGGAAGAAENLAAGGRRREPLLTSLTRRIADAAVDAALAPYLRPPENHGPWGPAVVSSRYGFAGKTPPARLAQYAVGAAAEGGGPGAGATGSPPRRAGGLGAPGGTRSPLLGVGGVAPPDPWGGCSSDGRSSWAALSRILLGAGARMHDGLGGGEAAAGTAAGAGGGAGAWARPVLLRLFPPSRFDALAASSRRGHGAPARRLGGTDARKKQQPPSLLDPSVDLEALVALYCERFLGPPAVVGGPLWALGLPWPDPRRSESLLFARVWAQLYAAGMGKGLGMGPGDAGGYAREAKEGDAEEGGEEGKEEEEGGRPSSGAAAAANDNLAVDLARSVALHPFSALLMSRARTPVDEGVLVHDPSPAAVAARARAREYLRGVGAAAVREAAWARRRGIVAFAAAVNGELYDDGGDGGHATAV